jgi:hypothetical protein
MTRKAAAKPSSRAFRIASKTVSSNSDTNAKRECLDAAVAGSDVAAWLAATHSSREGDKGLIALAKFVTARTAESDAARDLVYCTLVLARRAFVAEADAAFGSPVQAAIAQRKAHRKNLLASNADAKATADEKCWRAFDTWRQPLLATVLANTTIKEQRCRYARSRKISKRQQEKLRAVIKAKALTD